jgi:signal transduction histidine kinase
MNEFLRVTECTPSDSTAPPQQRQLVEAEPTDHRLAWLATFSDQNPNPIAEFDRESGIVHYANPAARRLFPELERDGLSHPWLAALQELARGWRGAASQTARREVAIGEHCYALTVSYHAETQRVRVYGSDITGQKRVEDALRESEAEIIKRTAAADEILRLNAELEQRLIQRTAQLEAANKEMESFSYSVSHDLRAPLRAMDGFSQAVLEDYAAQLPEEGRRYLETIRAGAQRMGALIDDLLAFSRLSRLPLNRRRVDTARLVRETLEEFAPQHGGRRIEIRVGELPPCEGDPALLKEVWVNLLSNAFKFTGLRESAVIEIGCTETDGEAVFLVRDNGAGFAMHYAGKLFGVFQRLHRAEEYEGTGVGLAIVQRIIQRHGGRIWAEAEVDRGATFYFTLKEAPRK